MKILFIIILCLALSGCSTIEKRYMYDAKGNMIGKVVIKNGKVVENIFVFPNK